MSMFVHTVCVLSGWLIGKDSDAGRDWGQEEKGTTEDEMAGWHHWLDGHEFGWTPGVGDGQGGLACRDSWGCKESDTTKWLNWTELKKDSLWKGLLLSVLFTKQYSLHLVWKSYLIIWFLQIFTFIESSVCSSVTLINSLNIHTNMCPQDNCVYYSNFFWKVPLTLERYI